MEQEFFLGGADIYNINTGNTTRRITYYALDSPLSNSEYSVDIENDSLVLNFMLGDTNTFFFSGAGSVASWTKTYYFVVKPNPCKMNSYFED